MSHLVAHSPSQIERRILCLCFFMLVTLMGCRSKLSVDVATGASSAIKGDLIISPNPASIILGDSAQLQVTTSAETGSIDLSSLAAYRSLDSSIAAVENDRADGLGKITAKAIGETTIEIAIPSKKSTREQAFSDAKAKTASVKVTVIANGISRIEILPISATVEKDSSQAFTANAVYANGTGKDITSQTSWKSLGLKSEKVAGNNGVFKGLVVGVDTIEAAYAGFTSSATLTVVEPSSSGPTSDSTAPIPGNSGALTLDTLTNDTVSFNWTTGADNVTSSANLTYTVYQSLANNISTVADAEANGTPLGMDTVNINTKSISGLNPSTAYYFNVIVKDEAGNKSIYNTLTATTAATADNASPTIANSGTITGSAVAVTSLTVQWTKSTDDTAAQSHLRYLAYYSTTNNLGSISDTETNGTPVGVYTSDIDTKTITGLTPSTTYYVNVIVKDLAGNKAVYATLSQTTAADTNAPTPGNSGSVAASGVSASTLTLSWAAASDDATQASSLQYRVYQSSSNNISSVSDAESNGTAVNAYSTNITTLGVSGLTPLTSYFYTIIVKDASGNKAVYQTASVTTSADTTPPTVGGSGVITLSGASATSMTLTWTKATDVVTPAANIQYLAYYSTTNNISSVANAETNGTAVGTYTSDIGTKAVTGLTPSTTYYFNVITKDAAGNKSIYTTASQATTSDVTAPSATSYAINTSNADVSTVDLSWTSATDDSTSAANLQYLVYYSTSNNISTIANAEANGTAFGVFTANITTKTVTGLSASTTYYFNVIVKDTAGNKQIYSGTSEATTTDSTNPTPGNSGTVSTASVGATGLTLNWTAATDNSTASTLQYRVYQSSSNNITTLTDAETNGTPLNAFTTNITTLNVTGLTGATTYYFNVVVKDLAGNKAVYAGVSQLTSGDSVAPTVTSGTIVVSSVTANTLTLTWTKATDNISTQSNLQYEIRLSTSNNISNVADAETNGTIVGTYTTDIDTKNITGLSANTTYYFNIIVKDEAQNKLAYTAISQLTTADSTAPTATSYLLTSSSVTQTSLSISWTAASDNTSASANLEYLLYYATSSSMTSVATVEANGTAVGGYTANITTKSVTGLTVGTTYYFNVIVKDEAGNKRVYTRLTQATSAESTPPTPGNSGTLGATSVTDVGMSVTWTTATDNVTAQASLQYLLYRSSSNNLDTVANIEANGTAVGSYAANISSRSVTGLNATTTYYFNVIVRDAAGNKAAYSGLSQATGTDATVPAVSPTTITTSSVSYTTLTLGWTKATDTVSAQANLQYEVRRSTSNNISSLANAEANGTIVGSYTADINTFNVTGLNPGTTYYFNVIVKDEAGNKRVYATKSQATLTDAVAPTAGGSGTLTPSDATISSIKIDWTGASDNIATASELSYLVYYSTSSTMTSVTEIESNGTPVGSYTTNITSKSISGLSSTTLYYFNVIVKDLAGNKTPYSRVSSATLSKPEFVFAFEGGGRNTISWFPVLGATSYNIYWSTTPGSGTSGTLITGVSAPYIHTGRTPNTNYYYVVTAVVSGSETAASTEVSATPFEALLTSTSLSATDPKQRKTFFDSVNQRHWVFSFNGAAISCAYSSDGITWTSSSTLNYVTDKFHVAYKSIGGTPYVYLVTESNNFDVVLRRGVLSTNSLTFDSEITVYDGSSGADKYSKPSLSIDSSDNIWVLASYSNGGSFQTHIKKSQNTGAGDLTVWNASSKVGIPTTTGIHEAILLPRSAGEMYLLIEDAGKVTGYLYSGGSWSSAISGTNFDWFSIYGDHTINTSALTPIHAAAIDGNNLYVGGAFLGNGNASSSTRTGLPNINYIARWDGTNWNAMGEGLNGTVYAIKVVGSRVYVGGNFTAAGGNPNANYIAYWENESWHALGSGLTSGVRAIQSDDNRIYAGGGFQDAGGNPNADRIAFWDGSTWNSLGVGLNAVVYSILILDGKVYAGGSFTDAGDNSNADRVTYWDGLQWNSMGSGIGNGIVNTLANSGSTIYAGGSFTDAGGVTAGDNIAFWNGTSWNALDAGTNAEVHTILVDGNNIYVGGIFTNQNGNSNLSKIMYWNGTAWTAMSTGLYGAIRAMVKSGGGLYAFGSTGPTIASSKGAYWDGSSWSEMGVKVASGDTISTVSIIGTDVYLAGKFDNFAGISDADNIVRWDGSQWHAVGGGLNGQVYITKVSGSDLYVGGSFTDAGGNTAIDLIARWNGTSWNTVGDPLNLTSGQIRDIEFSGSNIYVSGLFQNLASIPEADYVAYWDGTNWNALGSGLNSTVRQIAVSGSTVYASGGFINAGGDANADYLAYWDGASWGNLGAAIVDTSIGSFELIGGNLYIGGTFLNAGGNADADRIAYWDGTSWNAVGTGIDNGDVACIRLYNGNLYVSGGFLQAGGNSKASNFAYWDGTNWQAVGNGPNKNVGSFTIKASGEIYSTTSFYLKSIMSGTQKISAVSDTSGNIHLLAKTSAGVQYKNWDGTTWSSNTTLSATAGMPNLSYNQNGQELFGFYVDSGALKYKIYDFSSWGSESTLHSSKVAYPNCDAEAGDGKIKCTWIHSSPFYSLDLRSKYATP